MGQNTSPAVAQNRSTAVMQRRAATKEPRPQDYFDSLDYYPTPAWGTRALCEWLAKSEQTPPSECSAWEPACGEGHMAKPLAEYFGNVHASDVYAHGFGDVEDFLWPSSRRADWIITNPPFRLAQQFAATAIERANIGVALLVRIAFLEGAERHRALFQEFPPTDILQFVERLPMVKGRVDREASSATAYCWVIWRLNAEHGTRFDWLPPCRKRLERSEDYAFEAASCD